MTQRWRTLGLLVAAAAATVLPACEPLPPRTVFTVTTTADGVDAVLGDGLCEVTVGAGDCSLRAAIAEANAVPRAEVVVPNGTHGLEVADAADGDTDLDITGDVLVRGGSLALGGPAARILVAAFAPGGAGPAIVVAAGARLEMRNIDITLPSVASGGIEVAGRLVLDHSSIMSNGTPGVDVRLGGVARMTTSSIMSFGVPALRNAGETLLAYSSLAGVSASAVHGEAASTTSMTATRLQRYTMFIHLFLDPTGAMCSGTLPTSGGYNHAPNASCSLSQPTDRQADDDSWAEAIPQGVVGCGDSFAVDLYGGPRPGAGASACNIGAL